MRYQVEYQKGSQNRTDYLSRHAKRFDLLPAEEKSEACDLNNLLYLLHTTPIIDKITLSKIATETKGDQTLKELKQIIMEGKTYISKNASSDLKRFSQILNQIIITGNGILMKEEKIILPKSLQKFAINLAHQGAHPGQSGMQRRLRYHFFFHDMDKQVNEYVANCPDCLLFTDKKTKEPLKAHAVPDKCWSELSVDLFGPMPSSKHIVVVQDLTTPISSNKNKKNPQKQTM